MAILALALVVPTLLYNRDTSLLLEFQAKRPPVPAYGKITTIAHDEATMARVAGVVHAGGEVLPRDAFAASFDMYYEAQLDDCDPTKNFVMISGTNGASYLYGDIIAHFRARGYCTLNFDHRSHGRTEDVPGALTAELLAEDAAAIIRRVFGDGRPAHLLGWSLGGAVAYYLAIHHPSLVRTATLQGITSCFGAVLPDGSCDMSFEFPKWFFSRDLMLRLLGTELQGRAASLAIKMHHTDSTMQFFRFLKPVEHFFQVERTALHSSFRGFLTGRTR